MIKATYRWKGRIVTISAYEKRLGQQKIGEKIRKTSVTSTLSEEMVDHNAPTYLCRRRTRYYGRTAYC
jgi:hypothetical protein